MGRKKKGADIDDRVQQYLLDYELDDLNKSNDLASLRQMCQLEVNIETMYGSLKFALKEGDAKKIKDLTTAYKDSINAYTTLQTQLAIDRKKRASESEETPLSYIDKLKSQAKNIIDKRLKKLSCPACKVVIMKYHIYVLEKGDVGAIVFDKKKMELIRYSIQVECPKCGMMVKVNETEISN